MNLLTMEHIGKSFTDRELLGDISLGINEGERIGVIGINGTGKSTLLKIIAGLEETDSGTLTKTRGLRIAYLPQTPIFDEGKTILANVTAGLTAEEEYRNITGEAKSMLAKLGIPDSDRMAGSLSGGNQQKVVVAKWLARNSRVVIFDEPTRGIDVAAKVEIYQIINQLKKDGIVVIIVSSEMPEVMGISDRILVMCNGRITGEVDPRGTTEQEIMTYATQFGSNEY